MTNNNDEFMEEVKRDASGRATMACILLYALTTDYENNQHLLETLTEKDFNRGPSNLSTYLIETAIFRKVTELEKANRPISLMTVMGKIDDKDKEKANAILQAGQEEWHKLKQQNVSLHSVLDNWKSLKKKTELRAVLSEGLRAHCF